MRSKKVTRHYCDHCNKGMFQHPAMERHESVCSKNPNRSCFICGDGSPNEQAEKAAKEALKIFREKIILADTLGNNDPRLEELYNGPDSSGIMNACDGCPACALAAISQYGEGEHFNFDYKKEMADWRKEGRPF